MLWNGHEFTIRSNGEDIPESIPLFVAVASFSSGVTTVLATDDPPFNFGGCGEEIASRVEHGNEFVRLKIPSSFMSSAMLFEDIVMSWLELRLMVAFVASKLPFLFVRRCETEDDFIDEAGDNHEEALEKGAAVEFLSFFFLVVLFDVSPPPSESTIDKIPSIDSSKLSQKSWTKCFSASLSMRFRWDSSSSESMTTLGLFFLRLLLLLLLLPLAFELDSHVLLLPCSEQDGSEYDPQGINPFLAEPVSLSSSSSSISSSSGI
mmetsp:Transcript_4734/g.10590  ORF Transcript_4734/g.10590 Transcript_4734/m.10590 type:complete len:263 (-) Transcript_4734:312-1100(-)